MSHTEREDQSTGHAGLDFAQMLKPIGMFMVLGLFILVTALMFSLGSNPLAGYVPPETSEYFSQDASRRSELKSELEENVFPRLNGVEDCFIEDEIIVIEASQEDMKAIRKAILRYYDKDLFYFRSLQ